MSGKDGCKGRLQPSIISEILDMFGQEIFIFIREQSGSFEKRCLWQPCYNSVV